METPDYQSPRTPDGNHILGGWYAVFSCTLSMVSVAVLQFLTVFLAWDENGFSWRHAYGFACLPAISILLIAFGISFLLLRQRPRIRPVTIVCMIFNIGAFMFFVFEYPS